MTIKEFFESKDKLAIRCKCKQQAEFLCLFFNKLNYRWCDNVTRYTDKTHYEIYQKNTCYTNKRTFGDVDYLKKADYTIIDYKDIEVQI